ncbi:hypothetical protein [Luteibacter jiangsuensis]
MPPFVQVQVVVVAPVVEKRGTRPVCAGLRRFASRRFGARGLGRGGDGRADHQGQGHR